MSQYKTGDICKECGKGRIALMSTAITSASKDQEPYEGGKTEGNCEQCGIDIIMLNVEACEECGKVFKQWMTD